MKILAAVLLLSACAFAQGGYYADKAIGRSPGSNSLVAIPGASVQVCIDSACLTPASIYSSITLSIGTLIGNSTVTADSNGNFSFFATPGVYWCQVTATGFTTLSSQCQVGTTLPNIANIIFVDGAKYVNIAAAVTGAGSSQALIVIPSSYSGTECPASTVATITFWDLRGGSITCTQNSVSWNQTSASGLHSMARFFQTRTSPASSDTGVYSEAAYTGTLPANQTLSGGACEIDTTGALTIGANATLEGCETDFVLHSTGGTIPSLWGNLTAGGSLAGNTTNITTFANYRASAYNKAGSETVTNAYGIYLDAQSAGSVRNFSFYSQGAGLFSSDAFGSGINFEDSSLVTHPVLTALSATNQMRFRPLLDSAGFDFANGASSADWLILNSSAVSIPSLDLTLGKGITPDGGGFKHKRFGATTATAASANAVATTTYSWTTGFADTNYTPVCSPEGTITGTPVYQGVISFNTSGVTVQVMAATAAASSFGGMYCEVPHD